MKSVTCCRTAACVAKLALLAGFTTRDLCKNIHTHSQYWDGSGLFGIQLEDVTPNHLHLPTREVQFKDF